MGNEAIARGAWEAGVRVVTGYPGTPSSEVIMTFHEEGRGLPIYVEWAVNERVAFEIAYGAAIGGVRALVTMKAPGLNVASDPVLSAAYSGVEGGLVILVADDPGPHTTQTEQDSRWYAKLSKLPMFTASTPQEAKDTVKRLFRVSEELKLPVIFRTTTRLNHAVGDVVLGEVEERDARPSFKKDPPRFVRAGMKWNLERHAWLNGVLRRVEEVASSLGFNKVEGSGEYCVVTEGVAYNYVYEALRGLGEARVKVLRVDQLYPVPSKFLAENLSSCRRVIVVEELDPYLEAEVKKLAYEERLGAEVMGKEEGLLPLEGELNPSLVKGALYRWLGVPQGQESTPAADVRLPERPPPLCPGCPHAFSYIALKLGIARAGYKLSEVPVFGDIGCYALSVNRPIEAIWTEHSMGASISMAMGLKVAGYDKPVVATIGDSTFFHAGIPSLIEAVHKRVDMLVLILDNRVVAMTGHQSTPSWEVTESGRQARGIDIVEVVKSIGVDEVAVVDPYDFNKMVETVASMIKRPGVKVLVAQHPCRLMEVRQLKTVKKYRVIEDKCTGCRACVNVTGCPALYIEDGKAKIVEDDCTGCGLCARFCPYKAIVEVGGA
ncbi:indolepyruvate ferredoxin oxidoreductase subunit alpha [Thermogladius calderae 1633]|uniref:Indolepyruvate oxidoreductase subunit IorA n=1 Tax=Thermogladius calderae (strain DSM 22663 / VKM B-2946 / 1633) TaxID=1184251 RepID=I3TFK0_THEC1|nr:indolepyruvate ferredoxin oxidoreductase subunit alpha [Thermogladius calderae]AFK51538.1 indolepyruvate ferredoxin oxidoreductase subunit alpha [Thermogladius calderae 1633]